MLLRLLNEPVGRMLVIVIALMGTLGVLTWVWRRRRRGGDAEAMVAQLRRRGIEAGICPDCGGSGQTGPWKACRRCHGLGYCHELSDDEVFSGR